MITIMRFTGWHTWVRLAVVLAVFTLLPWIAKLIDFYGLFGTGGYLTMLFLIFPGIVLIMAAWDGDEAGFSLLWLVMPFVLFLPTMYLFFNSSALIYGVIYAVLGFMASAIGHLFWLRKQK